MHHYLLFIAYSFFSLAACSSSTEQIAAQREQDTLQHAVSEKNSSPDTLMLSKKELLGQINPAQHEGFTKIASKYTDKQDIYLRKETYEAFERMAAAAKQDGLDLHIISATRNFNDQKNIWEAKWNGQRKVDGQNISQTIPDPKQRALKILEYSSMPGSSRHHWGTDLDLNALDNDYFDSGTGKKLYDWLQAHAAEYGFCQVYTPKGPNRPNGYHEERWHWSYMPLASQFLKQYGQKVTHADIKGFTGADAAPLIEIIPNYVMGIAPACKNWSR